MNWEAVEQRLERDFSGEPKGYGSSRVVESPQPFPLDQVMNSALSDEEREEWGDLAYWPGSVLGLLEEDGVGERRLFYFDWNGFGPISWDAGLVLIGRGDRRYLCFCDEAESYLALAAIEPWDDPLAVSGTVRRLFANNGKLFGAHLFGSLPHGTTNYAPNLVSDAVIRQAYFDLLQYWERERGFDLAEEYYGRLIQGLPSLVSGPFWLREREDDGEAIPDHVRQRVFDQWFSGAYEEAVVEDAERPEAA